MPSDLFFFMEKRIKEIMLTTGVKMDRMIDVLHMWIIILIAIIRLWVKVQTQGLYICFVTKKVFISFCALTYIPRSIDTEQSGLDACMTCGMKLKSGRHVFLFTSCYWSVKGAKRLVVGINYCTWGCDAFQQSCITNHNWLYVNKY